MICSYPPWLFWRHTDGLPLFGSQDVDAHRRVSVACSYCSPVPSAPVTVEMKGREGLVQYVLPQHFHREIPPCYVTQDDVSAPLRSDSR